MSENTKNLMEKFLQFHALLARYVHHKRREQDAFADPHRGQGRVLALLKMQPEISQKDLAYLLDIRSQSLGELLTKLERNGFITRTQSEEDKRIVMLKLTDAGREAAEKATEQRMDMDNLFACLSTEEQETLNTLVGRLCENLQEQIGENMDDEPSHHCRHRERAFMNDRFVGKTEQFRNNFPQPPHAPEEPPFRR